MHKVKIRKFTKFLKSDTVQSPGTFQCLECTCGEVCVTYYVTPNGEPVPLSANGPKMVLETELETMKAIEDALRTDSNARRAGVRQAPREARFAYTMLEEEQREYQEMVRSEIWDEMRVR